MKKSFVIMLAIGIVMYLSAIILVHSIEIGRLSRIETGGILLAVLGMGFMGTAFGIACMDKPT